MGLVVGGLAVYALGRRSGQTPAAGPAVPAGNGYVNAGVPAAALPPAAVADSRYWRFGIAGSRPFEKYNQIA